jgi:CRISPR-associated endonuclease/helicase Cas3
MITGVSPMVEINADLRGLLREVAGFEAHDFQVDVARRLLEGENHVLVSPTGSGKSWAALLAFIYAKRHGIPFADRLIYAFPLRTLTTALYQQYGEYLQQEGLKATLQMGGMKRGEGDPFFEADVTFTTIDQLLSGYIGVPVSLPRRLANMPAGALIGSCVVFDEFHLLEPDKALATTLDLADQLGPYAQTLLMSATFSGDGINEIRRRAHAGKREVSPGELEHPNRPETRRKFVWSGREPSAAAVLDAHHERTIVVCNTVDRSTSLYREIVSLAEDRGIEDRILLLHARFLPEDRKVKENELLKLFGERSRERAILVATQVVEVGLDISADVFHSEVAPASAIIQRAGRCARFGGDGTVYVHELPKTDNKRSSAPYVGTQSSLVDSTADELAARSGSVFGFQEERNVLNTVHAETDLRNLKSVAPRVRRREVAQAIREGSGAYIRQLVREVDAVNLIVSSDPGKLRMELPLPSISVSRSVAKGFLAELNKQGRIDQALALSAAENREDSENYAPMTVWKPVEKVEDLSTTFYLCLPPELAAYDPGEGLVLGRSGDRVFAQGVEELAYEPYSYRKETWWDHIRRVMEQYEKQEHGHRVGAARLAKALGTSGEAVERMGLLAAALHDLGKLAKEWQDKMWLWQRSVEPEEPDCFLGHSDFDGTNDEQRKRIKQPGYRKPPHAVESYYAGLRILHQRLADQPDDLRKSIVLAIGTAIAHHHSAFASSLGEFSLQAGYEDEVRKTLEPFGLDGDLMDRPKLADRRRFSQDWFVNPGRREHENALLLYRYLVRRLRLADQKSNDW